MANGDFTMTLRQQDVARFNINTARELVARRLRVGLEQVTVRYDPDNHAQYVVTIATARPSATQAPEHDTV